MLKMLKLIKKKPLYNEHYPSILVTFLRENEHFSGKIRALRWIILVEKQSITKSLAARMKMRGRGADITSLAREIAQLTLVVKQVRLRE